MLTPKQIDFILKLTDHNLKESGKKLINKACYSFFLNYCVTTGCDICNQRQLWDETGKWTYLPSPKFNITGIKLGYLRLMWSKHPKENKYGMPHTTLRWMLARLYFLEEFWKNFKYFSNFLSYPAELCYPMPPENGK